LTRLRRANQSLCPVHYWYNPQLALSVYDWPFLADCVEKLGVEADRDR
jgi:hypothetical protein